MALFADDLLISFVIIIAIVAIIINVFKSLTGECTHIFHRKISKVIGSVECYFIRVYYSISVHYLLHEIKTSLSAKSQSEVSHNKS